MIDTRAVGQELQQQVLAAARKGHRRVTTTMKTVTATAQMIRPQLPALPANITSVHLPSRHELAKMTERQLQQLRKTAPALVARIPNSEHLAKLTEKQVEQLRKTAPGLIAKLPSREHLIASASDLAVQVRSVQRQVTDQVRTVTTPLAQQASSAFAQATEMAAKGRKAVSGTESVATTAASPGSETASHVNESSAAASHVGTAPRKAQPAKTTLAQPKQANGTPAKNAEAGKSAANGSAKPAKPAAQRSSSSNTKRSKDAGK